MTDSIGTPGAFIACKHEEGCDHDWQLPEWASPDNQTGWPQEVCVKCGMSMIRHIFTECP